MPLEYYKIGSVIGKGSYGEVTLAKHRKDRKQYVIKRINLQNASEKERNFAEQEVKILSKLRHPNIVSYKESFQDGSGHLHIVMGYCEGGDLYKKLKEHSTMGEPLGETQLIEWFVQITMALQYMHDRSILHRDLKTQNIFLTKSKIIKVGDLGIARVLDSNADMATTLIGTPYYMSPEMFSNKPYNHKSDVWALGCCVFEMATLKHAFNAKDMNALVYKILKGKIHAIPNNYSDELQIIIKTMLSHNPSERPSASRILRHPFIKKHIALFLEGTRTRSNQVENKPSEIKTKEVQSNKTNHQDNDLAATASDVDFVMVEVPQRPQQQQRQDQAEVSRANREHKEAVDKVIISKTESSHGKPADMQKRPSRSSRSSSSNPFSKPVAVACHRPLPPTPTADAPNSNAKKHSNVSPKVSIGQPNRSARQKRRDRISQEGFLPPAFNRRSSDVVDGSPSIISVDNDRVSARSISSSPSVCSQDSVSDGGSISDPDDVNNCQSDNTDASCFSKSDVRGLVNTLEETLLLDNNEASRQDSTELCEAEDIDRDSVHLATAGLQARINRLKEECLNGIGLENLRKAYHIIDTCDEDHVEDHLVRLIGRQNFEQFGGQIWQLKFCEEFRS